MQRRHLVSGNDIRGAIVTRTNIVPGAWRVGEKLTKNYYHK